jgi:SurA N-terminal domain
MRAGLKLGVVLLVALAATQCFAGRIVDRIVATVNSTPILQSDWETAIAFEALQQGRTVESFTPQERGAVLGRMVDAELLREQMGDTHVAEPEQREIEQSVGKLRALYPQGASDDGWHDLLMARGLNDEVVREKLAVQLEEMRFVNLRLRPESRIEQADVEAYYTNSFVPQVKARGQEPESVTAVAPQIREILRQQRMDKSLDEWLRDLRDHAELRLLVPDAETPAPTDSSSSSSATAERQ